MNGQLQAPGGIVGANLIRHINVFRFLKWHTTVGGMESKGLRAISYQATLNLMQATTLK
jgi:hypothetical protein